MAAHGPEEILRLLKLAQLLFREQPPVDKFRHSLNAVHIFANPEERVEIAQAPLAFFEVWLDDISAIPHPFVPRVALGELVGHKSPRCPCDNIPVEARHSVIINARVAPNIARLQQRCPNRQVAFSHLDHFIERAARMADFQSQIPQRVEHRFDDLLGPAGLLPRGNERDIDVRVQPHLAATIAAHREEGQTLRGCRVIERIKPLSRKIEDDPQNLIGEKSIGRGCFPPRRRSRPQPFGNFCASSHQRRLKCSNKYGAHRRLAVPNIRRQRV